MKIRNGFIRDRDGIWHNLKLISQFYVSDTYRGFVIYMKVHSDALMKCHEGSSFVFLGYYKKKSTAIKKLDRLMENNFLEPDDVK